MKKVILSCLLFSLTSPHVWGNQSASSQEQDEFNRILNEIKTTGIKPTDSNIYNICFASSMLLTNAANDAMSGQYVGDRMLGEVLLVSHDEYKDIVKALIKSDAVNDIRRDPDSFDKNFQMKCRASPESYIKNYKKIFRLKMTESDLKNQW
ncbi:hypothetical protein Q0S22_03280 [Escherichia coli O93:H19]